MKTNLQRDFSQSKTEKQAETKIDSLEFRDLRVQKLHNDNEYALIPGEIIGSLSPSCLGAYIYLSSLPSELKISAKIIQDQFSIGREKTSKIIKTLKDAGLIEFIQIKNENGSFGRGYYVVKGNYSLINGQ